jgi:SAM-dependent methyltransferase
MTPSRRAVVALAMIAGLLATRFRTIVLGGDKPLARMASAVHAVPEVLAATSEADAEEAARLLRFDEFYNGEGNAPWDIQKPQAAVVQFERAGAFRGKVLDVGCGSGDNAIFLASKGHNVTGVDFIGTAIKLGRARSAALAKEGRQLALQFHVGSAFDLAVVLGAGANYDTVLDSGFFHTLHTDKLRDEYATSLAAVVHSGSRLMLLAMRAGEEEGQTEDVNILSFRVNVEENALTQQLAKAGWRVDSIVTNTFVNEKRAENGTVVTWARPMWAVTATKL